MADVEKELEEDLVDYNEDATLEAKPASEVSTKKYSSCLFLLIFAPLLSMARFFHRGSYVGIHSAGFRDFLLKPEIIRAVTDCGFEHPSEGI